jgi:UDP-3-O-[3-hydroxymyristoyl] glucosamine N-acyltransferase
MAGCSAIAGSTQVGERVTIGGQAGLVGHVRIGDDVHIAAKSTVTRSLLKPGVYGGHFPLDENRAWEKTAAVVRQLPALRDRLRTLERSVREGGAPRPAAADTPADAPTDE